MMAKRPFEAEGCVAPTCQNKAKAAFHMMSYGSMPTRLATKTNGLNRFARGETCPRAVPVQALLVSDISSLPSACCKLTAEIVSADHLPTPLSLRPRLLPVFLAAFLSAATNSFATFWGDACFLSECRVVRGGLHEAVLLRGFRWHYKPPS